MKDNKKNEEEQVVKNVAQAEQILEQEEALKHSTEEATPAPAEVQPTTPTKGRRRGSDRERRGPPKRSSLTDSGLVEKVVSINRVSKTTKGGTRLAFSALVVVGDTKGKVGYGLGKAGEVATAIKKGLNAARKSMIFIPRRGTTITHEILGKYGSASVLLKPASEGTGVIAAGAVRAVCDGAGISNILTKCHRSNNPINVVKATFEGLSRLKVIKVITEN
ncbi:MAG: 30S ribosomal protein S5 [Candidatus Omnitrophica bacterium]|nr:30S ribosomal protein S5 [Candidatus Omnitrophota bacterium]